MGIVAAALVVVGGGVVAAVKVAGSGGEAKAVVVAERVTGSDSGSGSDTGSGSGSGLDSDSGSVTVTDAGSVMAATADAAAHTTTTFVGRPARDAATAPAVPVPVDASANAAIAFVVDAATLTPPAHGSLVVHADTWCDVTIDNVGHGRRSDVAIALPVGHHVLTCAQQGTGRIWNGEVEIAADATVTVQASLLGAVEVTLAVDATIDGVAYRHGAVAKVVFGRHRVAAGGAPTWIDVEGACVLRADPTLDCYPR